MRCSPKAAGSDGISQLTQYWFGTYEVRCRGGI